MVFKSLEILHNLGAIIDDIDLSNTLSDKDILEIKDLFFNKHILVFKNQNLSEEEQLKFTENFGNLEIYPEFDKTNDSSKTYHVANVSQDGKHLTDNDEMSLYQKVNQRWHTDSSYRFTPSYASLLYGIEVLPDSAEGGETEFVNMFKVYENLEEPLKLKLESLHMVHYYEFGRRLFPELPPISTYEKKNVPPVSHPLIRLHPDRNNEKSLFFTANAGNQIGGMSQKEGEDLHKSLVDIVSKSPYRYKHRWQKGDLVMWDNKCLLHRAIPYDMNQYRRVFRRTTVAGLGAIKGPFLDPAKL